MDGFRTERWSGILFHGSDVEFEVPRPMTHFGTREAATSAPNFGGILMSFQVELRRALLVPDSPGGGDCWEWLNAAREYGVVSDAEFMEWEACPTPDAFIALLVSKGIDGLIYENEFEDRGSRSFVIFEGDQAEFVQLEPVPQTASIR